MENEVHIPLDKYTEWVKASEEAVRRLRSLSENLDDLRLIAERLHWAVNNNEASRLVKPPRIG